MFPPYSLSYIVTAAISVTLYNLPYVRTDAEFERRELCQWEYFEASCGAEDVLVIHTAQYGRMELGRCVKQNFGYLGCGINAIVQLDRHCSGRHSCKFPVTSLHGNHECTNDLTAYLSVTYSCIKVTPCKKDMCRSSDFLKLTSPSGLIASIVTSQSTCGSPECPWVLQGQPGQRFNLTLIDFSHLNARPTQSDKPHSVCHRYATVREDEMTKDITACSADAAREKVIHMSETNSVKLYLYSSVPESKVHYLIKYSVIGCPDISPPRDATTQRKGNQLKVSCAHSSKAWHLTCQGNSWVGEIGTCMAKTASSTDRGSLLDTTNSPYGMLIVVALGIALGVAIGVFLLCIVLCYMKSKRLGRPQMTKNNHILINGGSPYGNNIGKPQVRMNGECVPISPGGAVMYTPEHNYTTTLHVKRPLPNPNVNGNNALEDHFSTDAHQMSDTDTILSENDYNVRQGEMQTFKPREHVYETPRFPIQDMGAKRNQMHSADGISRNFLHNEDRNSNNRTN